MNLPACWLQDDWGFSSLLGETRFGLELAGLIAQAGLRPPLR
jgi:hypothetical protein